MVDELVQVEGDERAGCIDGAGHVVTADRLGRTGDVAVDGSTKRIAEQGQALDLRV
jgi:hypothetical protein